MFKLLGLDVRFFFAAACSYKPIKLRLKYRYGKPLSKKWQKYLNNVSVFVNFVFLVLLFHCKFGKIQIRTESSSEPLYSMDLSSLVQLFILGMYSFSLSLSLSQFENRCANDRFKQNTVESEKRAYAAIWICFGHWKSGKSRALLFILRLTIDEDLAMIVIRMLMDFQLENGHLFFFFGQWIFLLPVMESTSKSSTAMDRTATATEKLILVSVQCLPKWWCADSVFVSAILKETAIKHRSPIPTHDHIHIETSEPK